MNDEVVVKRFQREAELLIHLNHPRIVQVHDHGYTKRGQPYFVMDYLVGQNLSQVINQTGPLDPQRVRHIFSQVCGAVDHAHRCGVIHRDLKPGNIMLLNFDGEKDYVKVVDFGIARFSTETNRLTRLGEVWGSPVYMSPEQCLGQSIDARSDVYSIGIAMYESLTGEVPFLGKNYVDTMSKQINEPPLPMNEARPGVDVPERLEQAVFKALSKDPHERHQSMAELREDIEDAFAQMPTSFRISRQRIQTSGSSSFQKAYGKPSARSSKNDLNPVKSTKNDIKSLKSSKSSAKPLMNASRNDMKPLKTTKSDIKPIKSSKSDMKPLRQTKNDIKSVRSTKNNINAARPAQPRGVFGTVKIVAMIAVAAVLLFLAGWGWSYRSTLRLRAARTQPLMARACRVCPA